MGYAEQVKTQLAEMGEMAVLTKTEPKKPVTIVHEPTLAILRECDTVQEAEQFIAQELMVSDPDGVVRGDYGIDAPEEMVNPIKR
jgi:hypothetical protein